MDNILRMLGRLIRLQRIHAHHCPAGTMSGETGGRRVRTGVSPVNVASDGSLQTHLRLDLPSVPFTFGPLPKQRAFLSEKGIKTTFTGAAMNGLPG